MQFFCVWTYSLSIPLLLLFSHSVVSDSLWLHGLQHISLPCPSPSPGACSNSSSLSRWCHPTISSSVVLFSSCLQSFPASGSFPVSRFFTSGGQSIPLHDYKAIYDSSFSILCMADLSWLYSLVYGYLGWKESYDQPGQHIKKQRHYFANKGLSS